MNSILFLAKSYLKKTSSASIRPLVWLEVDNFKEFWNSVIEYFQSFTYEIDDMRHPITSLYVEGDRKSKNTDIGKNIQSRHTQLLYQVSSWGIDYN